MSECLAAVNPLLRGVCLALTVYTVIVLVRVVLSWFPPPPAGPIRTVADLVFDLVDPVLKPLRSVLPPAGMLDFSPILLFVILAVLRVTLGC